MEFRELDMRNLKGESQVKRSKAESTKERIEDGPICKSVNVAVDGH